MDFALSAEQREVRDWVRTFVRREIMPLEPEVLLLDEPCSGLDPISTAKIEGALRELKKEMPIVLVETINQT